MQTLFIGIWDIRQSKNGGDVAIRSAVRVDGEFHGETRMDRENDAINHAVNKSLFHYCAGKKIFHRDVFTARAIERGDYIFSDNSPCRK